MDGTKKCGRCKADKPLAEFCNAHGGGKQSYCKPCEAAYHKERRAKHRAEADSRTPDHKKCSMCRVVLPSSCFYILYSSRDCLRDMCIECASIDKRAKRYRITVEEVIAYLCVPECQNPLCRMPFAPGKEGDQQMQFDHCHGNGHLRGVLCMRCNTVATGKVYECIERLRGLVQYLEDSEARRVERRATCHSA